MFSDAPSIEENKEIVNSDKQATTIATDPNEKPKLDGYPIPENNDNLPLINPIQKQDKNSGKLVNPTTESDKNSGVLAGAEIETGHWGDNVVTKDNRLPIPEVTTADNGLKIKS